MWQFLYHVRQKLRVSNSAVFHVASVIKILRPSGWWTGSFYLRSFRNSSSSRRIERILGSPPCVGPTHTQLHIHMHKETRWICMNIACWRVSENHFCVVFIKQSLCRPSKTSSLILLRTWCGKISWRWPNPVGSSLGAELVVCMAV